MGMAMEVKICSAAPARVNAEPVAQLQSIVVEQEECARAEDYGYPAFDAVEALEAEVAALVGCEEAHGEQACGTG